MSRTSFKWKFLHLIKEKLLLILWIKINCQFSNVFEWRVNIFYNETNNDEFGSVSFIKKIFQQISLL